jgi:hypothetical protein
MYGSNASGKSYTAHGIDGNSGIIPLSIEHIFDKIVLSEEEKVGLRSTCGLIILLLELSRPSFIL